MLERAAEQASVGGPSSRQLRVGQALELRLGDEVMQSVNRPALAPAFVQAEGKLVDVTRQMLRADLMVDADEAALEDGEETLGAVRRDAATREYLSRVVDRRMMEEQAVESFVDRRFVGVNRR